MELCAKIAKNPINNNKILYIVMLNGLFLGEF